MFPNYTVCPNPKCRQQGCVTIKQAEGLQWWDCSMCGSMEVIEKVTNGAINKST